MGSALTPARPTGGALVLGLLVGLVAFDAAASASPDAGRPCSPTIEAPRAHITAAAPDASQPRTGPSFLLSEAETGVAACLPNNLGNPSLIAEVTAELAAADLDPKLAVVLTTRNPGCDRIFYVPVANQVQGIGYAHLGEEVFDDSPESELEGVVFLNDFPYWRDHPDEYRTAFLHEVAHRKSGRVSAQHGDEVLDLTGREHAHWSYFLDSDSSPLEGNDYSDGSPFTTQTEHHPLVYSSLDLYLMGALAKNDVPPFRFFPGGAAEGTDCKGHPVQNTSPPQTCEPREIDGTPISLSIESVIQAEGERVPASDAPSSSVVFLVWSSEGFDLKMCSELAEAIDQNVSDYHGATQSQLELANLVSGATCDSLDYPPPAPPEGCSLAHPTGQPAPVWSLLVLVASVRVPRRRAGQNIAKARRAR